MHRSRPPAPAPRTGSGKVSFPFRHPSFRSRGQLPGHHSLTCRLPNVLVHAPSRVRAIVRASFDLGPTYPSHEYCRGSPSHPSREYCRVFCLPPILVVNIAEGVFCLLPILVVNIAERVFCLPPILVVNIIVFCLPPILVVNIAEGVFCLPILVMDIAERVFCLPPSPRLPLWPLPSPGGPTQQMRTNCHSVFACVASTGEKRGCPGRGVVRWQVREQGRMKRTGRMRPDGGEGARIESLR